MWGTGRNGAQRAMVRNGTVKELDSYYLERGSPVRGLCHLNLLSD